jgi:hypothetical protein
MKSKGNKLYKGQYRATTIFQQYVHSQGLRVSHWFYHSLNHPVLPCEKCVSALTYLKHRLHLVGQRTCGWKPRGHRGSPFDEGIMWYIALWRHTSPIIDDKAYMNKLAADGKYKYNNNDNINSKTNVIKTSDKTDWSRQNTLDLYLEGVRFETRPGYRLSDWGISRFSSSFPDRSMMPRE